MVKLNIQKLLKRRGQTVYWLAKKIDMPHNRIMILAKNDMKMVTLDVVDKICNVLECTVAELIIKE